MARQLTCINLSDIGYCAGLIGLVRCLTTLERFPIYVIGMRQRLVALLLVIAFVGPIAAQGFNCATSGSPHKMDMACCQEAKLPTGSAVAKTCCELLCGKSTGDLPLSSANATPQLQAPALFVKVAWFLTLPPPARAAVPYRAAPRPAQASQVSHLYLKNSAFLI